MGDHVEDIEAEPDENPHPEKLVNQTPEFISSIFSNGLVILEQYGWLIVIGLLLLLYIVHKLKPTFNQLKQKAEDVRDAKKYDPDTAHQRLEKMEAARRRLQEEYDLKAAKFAEQQKIKEEEKRQQKIQDYEDRLAGKSGRSKFKTKEEEVPTTINKPKGKPRLRQSEFNPLMGGGGSSGYRPPQRRGGGG